MPNELKPKALHLGRMVGEIGNFGRNRYSGAGTATIWTLSGIVLAACGGGGGSSSSSAQSAGLLSTEDSDAFVPTTGGLEFRDGQLLHSAAITLMTEDPAGGDLLLTVPGIVEPAPGEEIPPPLSVAIPENIDEPLLIYIKRENGTAAGIESGTREQFNSAKASADVYIIGVLDDAWYPVLADGQLYNAAPVLESSARDRVMTEDAAEATTSDTFTHRDVNANGEFAYAFRSNHTGWMTITDSNPRAELAYGFITFVEDGDGGTWTYTIDNTDAAVNALAGGGNPDTLTETIFIRVTDEGGRGQSTVSDGITITIIGANDAPSIATTTEADTTLTRAGQRESARVTTTDPDRGDAHTYTITPMDDYISLSEDGAPWTVTARSGYGMVQLPTVIGTLEESGSGLARTYTFIPDAAAISSIRIGLQETISFSVSVSDGIARSAEPAVISFTLSPPNVVPEITVGAVADSALGPGDLMEEFTVTADDPFDEITSLGVNSTVGVSGPLPFGLTIDSDGNLIIDRELGTGQHTIAAGEAIGTLTGTATGIDTAQASVPYTLTIAQGFLNALGPDRTVTLTFSFNASDDEPEDAEPVTQQFTVTGESTGALPTAGNITAFADETFFNFYEPFKDVTDAEAHFGYSDADGDDLESIRFVGELPTGASIRLLPATQGGDDTNVVVSADGRTSTVIAAADIPRLRFITSDSATTESHVFRYQVFDGINWSIDTDSTITLTVIGTPEQIATGTALDAGGAVDDDDTTFTLGGTNAGAVTIAADGTTLTVTGGTFTSGAMVNQAFTGLTDSDQSANAGSERLLVIREESGAWGVALFATDADLSDAFLLGRIRLDEDPALAYWRPNTVQDVPNTPPVISVSEIADSALGPGDLMEEFTVTAEDSLDRISTLGVANAVGVSIEGAPLAFSLSIDANGDINTTAPLGSRYYAIDAGDPIGSLTGTVTGLDSGFARIPYTLEIEQNFLWTLGANGTATLTFSFDATDDDDAPADTVMRQFTVRGEEAPLIQPIPADAPRVVLGGITFYVIDETNDYDDAEFGIFGSLTNFVPGVQYAGGHFNITLGALGTSLTTTISQTDFAAAWNNDGQVNTRLRAVVTEPTADPRASWASALAMEDNSDFAFDGGSRRDFGVFSGTDAGGIRLAAGSIRIPGAPLPQSTNEVPGITAGTMKAETEPESRDDQEYTPFSDAGNLGIYFRFVDGDLDALRGIRFTVIDAGVDIFRAGDDTSTATPIAPDETILLADIPGLRFVTKEAVTTNTTYDFTYEVYDGVAWSRMNETANMRTGTFALTVTDANRTPTVMISPADMPEAINAHTEDSTFTITGEDLDGDEFTYTVGVAGLGNLPANGARLNLGTVTTGSTGVFFGSAEGTSVLVTVIGTGATGWGSAPVGTTIGTLSVAVSGDNPPVFTFDVAEAAFNFLSLNESKTVRFNLSGFDNKPGTSVAIPVDIVVTRVPPPPPVVTIDIPDSSISITDLTEVFTVTATDTGDTINAINAGTVMARVTTGATFPLSLSLYGDASQVEIRTANELRRGDTIIAANEEIGFLEAAAFTPGASPATRDYTLEITDDFIHILGTGRVVTLDIGFTATDDETPDAGVSDSVNARFTISGLNEGSRVTRPGQVDLNTLYDATGDTTDSGTDLYYDGVFSLKSGGAVTLENNVLTATGGTLVVGSVERDFNARTVSDAITTAGEQYVAIVDVSSNWFVNTAPTLAGLLLTGRTNDEVYVLGKINIDTTTPANSTFTPNAATTTDTNAAPTTATAPSGRIANAISANDLTEEVRVDGTDTDGTIRDILLDSGFSYDDGSNLDFDLSFGQVSRVIRTDAAIGDFFDENDQIGFIRQGALTRGNFNMEGARGFTFNIDEKFLYAIGEGNSVDLTFSFVTRDNDYRDSAPAQVTIEVNGAAEPEAEATLSLEDSEYSFLWGGVVYRSVNADTVNYDNVEYRWGGQNNDPNTIPGTFNQVGHATDPHIGMFYTGSTGSAAARAQLDIDDSQYEMARLLNASALNTHLEAWVYDVRTDTSSDGLVAWHHAVEMDIDGVTDTDPAMLTGMSEGLEDFTEGTYDDPPVHNDYRWFNVANKNTTDWGWGGSFEIFALNQFEKREYESDDDIGLLNQSVNAVNDDAILGTLSSTDHDGATFALVSGAEDNNMFDLTSAGQLTFRGGNTPGRRDNGDNFTIRVRVTPDPMVTPVVAPFEEDFIINLRNNNLAPEASVTSVIDEVTETDMSAMEDDMADANGMVTATDANPGTAFVFEVGTGAGAVTFFPTTAIGGYGNLELVSGTGASRAWEYTLGQTSNQLAALNALDMGDGTRMDIFTVRVGDSAGGTDTETITITVNGRNEPPVNHPPVARVSSSNAPEDVTVHTDNTVFEIIGTDINDEDTINYRIDTVASDFSLAFASVTASSDSGVWFGDTQGSRANVTVGATGYGNNTDANHVIGTLSVADADMDGNPEFTFDPNASAIARLDRNARERLEFTITPSDPDDATIMGVATTTGFNLHRNTQNGPVVKFQNQYPTIVESNSGAVTATGSFTVFDTDTALNTITATYQVSNGAEYETGTTPPAIPTGTTPTGARDRFVSHSFNTEYGRFSINTYDDSTGVGTWIYILNDEAALSGLDTGESVQEQVRIIASDGTTNVFRDFVFTIDGADETLTLMDTHDSLAWGGILYRAKNADTATGFDLSNHELRWSHIGGSTQAGLYHDPSSTNTHFAVVYNSPSVAGLSIDSSQQDLVTAITNQTASGTFGGTVDAILFDARTGTWHRAVEQDIDGVGSTGTPDGSSAGLDALNWSRWHATTNADGEYDWRAGSPQTVPANTNEWGAGAGQPFEQFVLVNQFDNRVFNSGDSFVPLIHGTAFAASDNAATTLGILQSEGNPTATFTIKSGGGTAFDIDSSDGRTLMLNASSEVTEDVTLVVTVDPDGAAGSAATFDETFVIDIA